MVELDLEKVARHLEAVLGRERRKAMEYTLLTVLCTPGFVVLGASLVALAAAYVVWQVPDRHHLDAMTFYTAVNAFLAFMLVAVMKNSGLSSAEFRFDGMWIAGAVLFALLLVLTYVTPLPDLRPGLFGLIYAIGGLGVLCLISQASPEEPYVGSVDDERLMPGFLLAGAGLITSAYRELFGASWLWSPPQPHEIRIAARLLCRLSVEQDNALSNDIVEKRIVIVLARLALIRTTQHHLHLTPKGLDFLQTAGKE